MSPGAPKAGSAGAVTTAFWGGCGMDCGASLQLCSCSGSLPRRRPCAAERPTKTSPDDAVGPIGAVEQSKNRRTLRAASSSAFDVLPPASATGTLTRCPSISMLTDWKPETKSRWYWKPTSPACSGRPHRCSRNSRKVSNLLSCSVQLPLEFEPVVSSRRCGAHSKLFGDALDGWPDTIVSASALAKVLGATLGGRRYSILSTSTERDGVFSCGPWRAHANLSASCSMSQPDTTSGAASDEDAAAQLVAHSWPDDPAAAGVPFPHASTGAGTPLTASCSRCLSRKQSLQSASRPSTTAAGIWKSGLKTAHMRSMSPSESASTAAIKAS
mmetsp:Transcript_65768/g.189259  ORF Transcript_65768/g.189259 Transcript_65768/m.189259 type:complete len:328 (+) Transcript_65768:542-1525(+)